MPKPKSPPAAAAGTPSRDGYHHGALREALIDAAEAVLAERGVEGFSLREVARRSGVSPAAPAHHFGDAAGLLAAVSSLAFDGLTAALEAGNMRGGDDPVARLREQGVAYVGFALKHPGRFGLMFRCGPHEADAVDSSGRAAFSVLEAGIRGLYGTPADEPLPPLQWQALLAVWSVVHGFAHLALAGQFNAFTPPEGREAMLRATLAPMLDLQLGALRAGAPPPVKRRIRPG
ncbi:TetR/AcrR family transcriptional regulator [Rhizobacter sp. Root1221]|uniref:TetR/AcrR family transcriptional regulator n=1 Tax=Rhizobacter sp. Root1221 TaxID=1736433 RepID=UPI0009E9C217|nr:TetR/AcrR family transcriptional regulator [Rhizobacter sp. Root1221]